MNPKIPPSFQSYNPPKFYGGSEPRKTIFKVENIKEIYIDIGQEIPTLEKIEGVIWVLLCKEDRIEETYDYYLTAQRNTEVPNPRYNEQISHYNLTKKVFNEQLEEWNKYKKIWDNEQAKIKLVKEKEEYERLKAKYG